MAEQQEERKAMALHICIQILLLLWFPFGASAIRCFTTGRNVTDEIIDCSEISGEIKHCINNIIGPAGIVKLRSCDFFRLCDEPTVQSQIFAVDCCNEDLCNINETIKELSTIAVDIHGEQHKLRDVKASTTMVPILSTDDKTTPKNRVAAPTKDRGCQSSATLTRASSCAVVMFGFLMLLVLGP